MSVVALAPPPPAPNPQPFRLSVATYHRMIADGLLTENDRVELVAGLLVQKMTQNPPHAGAVRRVQRLLSVLLPPGWEAQSQLPITLPDSEPEPDGAAVRADTGQYRNRHPSAAECGLIVEVADSSLAFDRSDKGQAYASAGITLYWIINLIDGVVEVYTQPSATGYAHQQNYRPGDSLDLVLDGQLAANIAVADLLP